MGAILIHDQYGAISLFFLMTCAIIISTSFTLLLVTGWHSRTLITIVSTLIGTFLCVELPKSSSNLPGKWNKIRNNHFPYSPS